MSKKHQKLLQIDKAELSKLSGVSLGTVQAFNNKLLREGQNLYRDLEWRNTYDPYEIWISEVMLQQTQVSRVQERWTQWIEMFPTVDALASASQVEVLQLWQGLGYNRRALLLKRAADYISASLHGIMPQNVLELEALPGIGPATAAGIVSFAFNKPALYLETNVRSVLLHEFYPTKDQVSDDTLYTLLALLLPDRDYKNWYYAFLDYGNYLKLILPNPSRRSKHHSTQSKFEGSHRQKRSFLLRMILSLDDGELMSFSALRNALNSFEESEGRIALGDDYVREILRELIREGFVKNYKDGYRAS